MPARPEHQLLLLCARTRTDTETGEKIRSLLGEGIDWEYLQRQSHAHGLLPLVSWHLETSAAGALPESVRLDLRARFHANARRNLALVQELLGVIQSFSAGGITAIPFKGPILAASTYGNLALRSFSDLDILVRERDVAAGSALLVARGYKQLAALTPPEEAAYLRSECQHRFLREDGTLVELHWGLAPSYFSFAHDRERLFSRLTSVSLGGVSIATFPPEDLLLILCVHGAKHCWERLEWICGVGEVVRAHPDLDWVYVRSLARSAGGERMLLLGVFLARELLRARVPSEVLDRVEADSTVRALATDICGRLFGNGETLRPYDRHRFHVRARERLRDRALYLLRLTFTPGPLDWAVVRLPPAFHFLYYAVRIARLTGKRIARRRRPVSTISSTPRLD